MSSTNCRLAAAMELDCPMPLIAGKLIAVTRPMIDTTTRSSIRVIAELAES